LPVTSPDSQLDLGSSSETSISRRGNCYSAALSAAFNGTPESLPRGTRASLPKSPKSKKRAKLLLKLKSIDAKVTVLHPQRKTLQISVYKS
jgi:hypothetical protein